MAAVAFGLAGRQRARQLVRRPEHLGQRAYERFARLSTDNGATWGNDEVMSDAVSPLPLQPDANVQACYTGDYDRSYTTRPPTTSPGSTGAS